MTGKTTQRGVTLLELLTVIAIAAILMSVAIPSYRYVTTANRIASEVNSLLGDMQFARFEAVKEGQTVTVCPSTDGATCLVSTAWNSGWIVCPDPTASGTCAGGQPILRRQKTFFSTDSFISNNAGQAVIFNREGFVTGLAAAGALTIALHDATNKPNYTRCLAVGVGGLLTTQTIGQSIGAGQACT